MKHDRELFEKEDFWFGAVAALCLARRRNVEISLEQNPSFHKGNVPLLYHFLQFHFPKKTFHFWKWDVFIHT